MTVEPDDVVAPSLDRYARMVRRALDVPVALISIVEDARQIFPGAVGLPEPYQESRQTPLSHSFCQYVVKDSRPLMISDAREDQQVRDNHAIRDLNVVAYAGWPLLDHTGQTIGSVCAIHDEPHKWTVEEMEALSDLAAACSAELSQRALHQQAAEQAERYAAVSYGRGLLLALSERLASTRTIADISAAVEQVAQEELGCLHAGIWLRAIPDPAHVEPVRPPGEGGRGEPLTFVANSATDWAQAQRHAHLAVDHRNPLGEALLSGRLLLIGSRAEQNQQYPHLRSPVQVGETRAFMPLETGGHAYGAIGLVWPKVRELRDDDRVMIGSLCAYTAQAIERALLLQERVDVALTLQKAMLTRLPDTDVVRLAARYLPAAARDQVGGDWYDAIVMPDGTTHLMVGDVVGHDIAAAAVMGQLRGMLRTFAWTHSEAADTPARIVERLDRAVDHLGLEAMATLVLARVEHTADPQGHRTLALRWTNAGHPPPLLVDEDGRVRTLVLDSRGENDPMLGAAPHLDRVDLALDLPAGGTLLMYTDGLIERRGEDLDTGIDRVGAALGRHRDLPLDDLLDAVLADLVGSDPADDVVVLAVRFDPPSDGPA